MFVVVPDGTCRNEENTFWLLASLVEDILYPGTYAPKLEGCQVRDVKFKLPWVS